MIFSLIFYFPILCCQLVSAGVEEHLLSCTATVAELGVRSHGVLLPVYLSSFLPQCHGQAPQDPPTAAVRAGVFVVSQS